MVKRMGFKCVNPLLAMFCIFPCGKPFNMNLLGEFRKCRDIRFYAKPRIDTLLCHPSIFQSDVTRFAQRNNIGTTKSKVGPQRCAFTVLLPFYGNTNYPAARSRGVHNQIQAVAVPMATRAKSLYQLLCKLAASMSHLKNTTIHTTQ